MLSATLHLDFNFVVNLLEISGDDGHAESCSLSSMFSLFLEMCLLGYTLTSFLVQ